MIALRAVLAADSIEVRKALQSAEQRLAALKDRIDRAIAALAEQ
jgi:hypothetical protein